MRSSPSASSAQSASSAKPSVPRPAGPLPPLPLAVITGFLGAGKTTLLNRLLKDPALEGTVVIVNEFGEIGLDHLLVEATDSDMLLLSSGCLCCSIRGDLVATLEDLLRRRDNGRMMPFRRVVIETTGLADPAPILHTLICHPYLGLRFALDSVITVIDAINGADTLDTHIEALKQAAVADRLVLTKTDIDGATEGARAALVERLRQLNPAAPILEAARGEAVAGRLFDAGLYDPDGKIADVRGWLNAEAFADAHAGHRHHPHHDHAHHHHGDHHHNDHHHHEDDGHGHKHDDRHHHDVNRHDARIRAFCLSTPTPIGRGRFDAFLDLLRSAHGPNLLRVKGIVRIAEDPDHPVVVQGVQHLFHAPVTLPAWPDADHTTRLVFILRDLDESFVRRLWSAFTGAPVVDGPDAAALTDNPLALRR